VGRTQLCPFRHIQLVEVWPLRHPSFILSFHLLVLLHYRRLLHAISTEIFGRAYSEAWAAYFTH
jgi:hypothetical protein